MGRSKESRYQFSTKSDNFEFLTKMVFILKIVTDSSLKLSIEPHIINRDSLKNLDINLYQIGNFDFFTEVATI